MFRVAHIALDAEGRQVSEANVFPPALRLDVDTEWRPVPVTVIWMSTRGISLPCAAWVTIARK